MKEFEINKDRKKLEKQYQVENVFDDSEVDDDSYMQIMAATASNSASSNNLLWDMKASLQSVDHGSIFQNFESRSPCRTLSALSLLGPDNVNDNDNVMNYPMKTPTASGSGSVPVTGFINSNGLGPDVDPKSPLQVWLAAVVVVVVALYLQSLLLDNPLLNE